MAWLDIYVITMAAGKESVRWLKGLIENETLSSSATTAPIDKNYSFIGVRTKASLVGNLNSKVAELKSNDDRVGFHMSSASDMNLRSWCREYSRRYNGVDQYCASVIR